MTTATINYHKTLAEYFSCKSLYLDEPANKKPNIRKLVEQPWQQRKAEAWDEVIETLCNLDFIQAKSAARMTFDLIDDFIAAMLEITDNSENIRKENQRQERLNKYARDLVLYANGEICELEVPESIKPWSEKKIESEVERIRNHPTRSDRLRSFTQFLGQEAGVLQNYAHELPDLAIQQAWNNYDSGPVGKAAEKASPGILVKLILRISSNRQWWNPLPIALKTLYRHSDAVFSISMTSDGKQAISASGDNTCILWDLESGRPLKTLIVH